MSVNKVRVLPFDTPGVPPSVPFYPHGYYHLHCGDGIRRRDIPSSPLLAAVPRMIVGFYCTQPVHSEDAPHVCHFEPERSTALIIWGGE